MTRLEKKNGFHIPFKAYMFISSAFYFLVTFAGVSTNSNFVYHNFYLMTLLLTTWYGLAHFSYYWAQNKKKFVQFYLLFQVLSAAGIGIEWANPLPLLLALGPAIWQISSSHFREGRKKGVGLFALGVSIYFSGIFVFQIKQRPISEVLFLWVLLVFAAKLLALCYYGSQFGMSFISSLKGRDQQLCSEEVERGDLWLDRRDKNFFYDMVTLFNNLEVFAKKRIALGRGLSESETLSLISHIKTYKYILRDQFDLSTVGIPSSGRIKFSKFKLELDILIDAYFSSYVGSIDVNFVDQIGDPLSGGEDFFIPRANITRILSNLFKMRYLEGDGKGPLIIDLTFSLEGGVFKISLKNKIFNLKSSIRDIQSSLDKKLQKLILSDDKSNPIEEDQISNHYQALMGQVDSLEGHVKLYLDDPFWVTEVNIPVDVIKSSEHKKAA